MRKALSGSKRVHAGATPSLLVRLAVSRVRNKRLLRTGVFEAFLSVTALLPNPALATSVYTTGLIQQITVSPGGNSFGFQLVGFPALCNQTTSGDRSWSGVTVGFGGTQTLEGLKEVLAALMAAKLRGSTVSVQADDNGPNGSCLLQSLQFN
jgi:hypothetical protein